jgi:hypothetical protein
MIICRFPKKVSFVDIGPSSIEFVDQHHQWMDCLETKGSLGYLVEEGVY